MLTSEEKKIRRHEAVIRWRNENPDLAKRRALEYYYKNHEISKKRQRDRYTKMKLEGRLVVKPRKTRVKKEKVKVKPSLERRLGQILRTRLNIALKENRGVASAVRLLGCSMEEFIKHMERGFSEGMNWENHTIRGWHIDHIRPLSSFDLTSKTEIAKACHFTNLQPLWFYENISKKAKILD